jgi:hypothetical protein
MADGALNTVFTKKNLIKYKQSFEGIKTQEKVSLQLLGELKMFSFWVNHPSGEFLSEEINKVTLQDAVTKLISFRKCILSCGRRRQYERSKKISYETFGSWAKESLRRSHILILKMCSKLRLIL